MYIDDEVNHILPASVVPDGLNDCVAICTILWLTVSTGCCVVKFFTINKLLDNVVLLLLDIFKYCVLPDLIKNKLLGFTSTLAVILPVPILNKLNPTILDADMLVTPAPSPKNEPLKEPE